MLFFFNEEYCLKVIGAFALTSFRIYLLLSFMNFNGEKFSDDFFPFFCFKGRSVGPLIVSYDIIIHHNNEMAFLFCIFLCKKLIANNTYDKINR